jgi:hypothetical protein
MRAHMLTRRKRREPALPNATTADSSCRELASRKNDGLHIVLLWHPHADEVTVSIADACTGDRIEFFVDPARALDAFRHPFVYAP